MAIEVVVDVYQVSESVSEGAARRHRVTCDRPEAKGGEDKGPMGGEMFLFGLGGCFMSNLLAAIKAREADVSEVKVQIRGTLDGTPTRYTEVEMLVSARYRDRAEMEKLLVIAERGCIVANTLKEAVRLNIVLK